MENLDNVKAKEIIEEYIEKLKNSDKKNTINSIVQEDFISKYMPKIICYKATDNIEEKKKQFEKVIYYYSDYICLLKQICDVKNSEFLAIMFNYDIICNNSVDDKDRELQRLLNIYKFNRVPEVNEKITYHSKCYFDYVEDAYKRGQGIPQIINNILTKKFAYNMYSYFIKNKNISIKDKIQMLEKASNTMFVRYNLVTYTDLYENITDLMIKHCEDIDLFSDKEEFRKNKKMLQEVFEQIDFPQFFETIGDTPEQIMFQSACKGKKIDYESNEFIVNVLKLLDECGDKIGKYRRNKFFSELMINMQSSFNKVMDTEDEEKIKECIILYNKAKYNEKLDFSLQKNISERRHKNVEAASENPIFKDMEEKISEKILEFAEKDFNGCMSFLKKIKEFVVGENKFVSNYKFRDEVLPEMMGVELSDEDIGILEGKNSFDEIVRFVNRKAKSIKDRDELGK